MLNTIGDLETRLANASSARERIDALNALAWELARNEPDRAQSLSQQAGNLAQSGEFEHAPYIKGQADSLSALSHANRIAGRYEESLSQAFEALGLYERLAHIPGQIRTLGLLGAVYQMLGDYPDALNYIQSQARLADSIADPDQQARAANNSGNVYLATEHYAEALQYFEKALELSLKVGSPELEAGILSNTSRTHKHLGHYDRALEDSQRSLMLFRSIANVYGQVYALNSLAELNIELNHSALAVTDLTEGLRLAEAAGIREAVTRINLNLGVATIKQKEYDTALGYLRKALSLAEEVNHRDMVYRCHEQLATVYQAQGDFEHALRHYQLFHQIRDDVLSQENLLRIKGLEIAHQTEAIQKQAELYKVEKQLVEEQRLEDRRYFERLAQMQDEFMNATTHDLKNPLTVMRIYIDLMRRREPGWNDTKARNELEIMDQQVSQMQSLVGTYLELAKLETGRAIETEPLRLNGFIAKIVEPHEQLARQRGLDFQVRLASGPLTVLGDPALLQRVMDNLISNAIKFTPTGGKVVVELDSQPGEVVLSVEDTGDGISEDDLPHIFERFFRGQQAAEGSGLGLAIAHTIVEQHGGTIRVESKSGAGSTFRVTLRKTNDSQP